MASSTKLISPWNSKWCLEETRELHWRRHQCVERREPRTRPSRTEGNAFATTKTGRSSRWRKEETTNRCLEPLVKLTGLKIKLRREQLMLRFRNSLNFFCRLNCCRTVTNINRCFLVHWLRWGCAEFRGLPLVDIDLLIVNHMIT